MKRKIKMFKIGLAAAMAVSCVVFAGFSVWKSQTAPAGNQNYVYAYVSSITGNEITYIELEESVVTVYLQEQEEAEETIQERDTESGQEDVDRMPDGEAPSGEMPDGEAPSGEMPDGEAPDGGRMDDRSAGRMNTKNITTLIPVGIVVHTQSDAETTFRRLASRDILQMLVETTENGEEVITEIWML